MKNQLKKWISFQLLFVLLFQMGATAAVPESNAEMYYAAVKLAQRIHEMTPKRKMRFYKNTLRLVNMAEKRVHRMSDHKFERKMNIYHVTQQSLLASDVETQVLSTEDQVVVDQFTNDLQPVVYEAESTPQVSYELYLESVQKVKNLTQGNTPKERFQSLLISFKSDLKKNISKLKSDRAPADWGTGFAEGIFVALLLIIIAPAALGLLIGAIFSIGFWASLGLGAAGVLVGFLIVIGMLNSVRLNY